MPYTIQNETLNNLQVLLRNQAQIPSYDPNDRSLPSLRSFDAAISQFDPSEPNFRCKHCNGKLIRGNESLFCVFCGKEQFDPKSPPDPINFRSTIGYKWLLESLKLDGSESIVLDSDAKDSKRRQNAPDETISISDLLNLEIRWFPKPEIPTTRASNEVHAEQKASPNLAGVDFDNFFVEPKRKDTSSVSVAHFEVPQQEQVTERDAFQGSGDLSLFENVQPWNIPKQSSQRPSGDLSSAWDAEFQSAGSGNLNKDTGSSDPIASSAVDLFPPKNSGPSDPFASSGADLSAHMDVIFGSGKESSSFNITNGQPSASLAADDWFQEDPRSTSTSRTVGHSENSQKFVSFVDAKTEGAAASSVNDFDWMQDNQWQTAGTSAHQSKAVDTNDESFDDWNDFTSSTSPEGHLNNSLQDTVDHGTLSQKTSESIFFNSPSNSKETGFGTFDQADLFSGASNHQNILFDGDFIKSEASVSTRMDDTNAKDGSDIELVKENDNGNANDVKMLISQMSDLSFMLDSNLSVPHPPGQSDANQN